MVQPYAGTFLNDVSKNNWAAQRQHRMWFNLVISPASLVALTTVHPTALTALTMAGAGPSGVAVPGASGFTTIYPVTECMEVGEGE